MDKISQSLALFQKGRACSQAILKVYGKPYRLSPALASRIASGFGGGMTRGNTCGAVTGAIMVLGLGIGGKHCETSKGRKKVYTAVEKFLSRFESRNGSILCRELLGCDIHTPEGMKTAREEQLFETKCPRFIRHAAEGLERLL
ncbi:MAG: C-GCAxxG-C-C family protein [Planctomycetota bacterium]